MSRPRRRSWSPAIRDAIRAADRVVVFPARARCPTACASSTAAALREAVVEAARDKPFLGICIGLQMLFERSEEGDTAGLGRAAGPGACASPDG